jgi:hypothetical protein
MLKYYDIQQNQPEWDGMRCGRMTGSNLATVMAKNPNPFGNPAKEYAIDIAIEQITGKSVPSYSNAMMEAGHEKEIEARIMYEAQTFSHVDNGGFFAGDFVGCSPDGIVLWDWDKTHPTGIIEIKSVTKKAATHYERVRKGGIPSEHKWQCFGNLLYTGAEWLDYISYCSWYPEGKQLYIVRLNREDCQEEFDQIIARVEAFRHLVNVTKNTILNSEYSI